jgi:hypothetical protein
MASLSKTLNGTPFVIYANGKKREVGIILAASIADDGSELDLSIDVHEGKVRELLLEAAED